MKRLLFCIPILFLVCTVLGSASFRLVKTANRTKTYQLPNALKEEVAFETQNFEAYGLANYAMDKTAYLLSFYKTNDLSKGRANCVGYAQLCSAIYNYGAKVNHIEGHARPVVGYVCYHKHNLCDVVSTLVTPEWKNFFKDHDFVEFDFGPTILYEDPCLYDMIGEKCPTTKIKK